jgi:hypothetical protein
MGARVADFNGYHGYRVKEMGSEPGELVPGDEITKDGQRVGWTDPVFAKAREDFENDWRALTRLDETLKQYSIKRPGLGQLQAVAEQAACLTKPDSSDRVRSRALLQVAAANGMMADKVSIFHPADKLAFGRKALDALRGAMTADPTNLTAFCAYAETLSGIDKGTHSTGAKVGSVMGHDPERETCVGLRIKSLDDEIASTIAQLQRFWDPDAGKWIRALRAVQDTRRQRAAPRS